MKKILALAIALSTTPMIATADTGFYMGLKTGSLQIDESAFDSDTSIGIAAGYRMGSWSVEFEANSADLDYDIFGSDGSADYRSLAVYGVYRSSGEFYFKAKAGVLNEEIKASFFTVDDTGVSAGIGIGARFDSLSIEAEYTVIETDINYFSVGANFYF